MNEPQTNGHEEPTQPKQAAIDSFRFYYLYGFSNDANKSSSDLAAFGKLYRLVIGETGGCFIPNSFHPYQLINEKGTSIWLAAYAYMLTRSNADELIRQFRDSGAVGSVPIASSFANYQVWPDRRLTIEEHSAFSTYMPFVVPFIIYDNVHPIQWDVQIGAAVEREGHAGAYLTEVNKAIRFLMPTPGFIVGFDEFDDRRPSLMIDHFVNALKIFARK